MITIRRIAASDADLFKDVRLRALKDSPDAFGSTYETAVTRSDASWQEQTTQSSGGNLRNTLLAFNQDLCIGLAALYREPYSSEGEVLQMWIEPEYRGTGAAAARLVSDLLVWASEVGLSTVSLTVTTTNEQAIRFYEKCGFRQTGKQVDVDSVRGLRGFRMQKELSEQAHGDQLTRRESEDEP